MPTNDEPTEAKCKKCNGTGYLYRAFYTRPRYCACPHGLHRSARDAMTEGQRETERLAYIAERDAARHARAEARRAASQ